VSDLSRLHRLNCAVRSMRPTRAAILSSGQGSTTFGGLRESNLASVPAGARPRKDPTPP
jgi:hypothetical protein